MKLSALLFLLTTANSVYSQDLIYLRTRTGSVSVKVLEINSTEVKYRFATDSLPVLYFRKNEVKRIELANGTIMDFEQKQDLNVNRRVGSVKTGFLAPVFGHVNLSYEGYISNRRSWEITAGAIGIGKQITDGEHAAGGYLKAGYKWIVSEMSDPVTHPQQLLNGFYVKPEVTLGRYNIGYDDRTEYDYPSHSYKLVSIEERKLAFGSIMMNLGYQLVFEGGFTLDASVGLGYFGVDIAGPRKQSERYFYAFSEYDGHSAPLAITGGLRIGYTFCAEKRFQLAE